MTFNWQGKIHDTATMTGFETGNPMMPVIYAAPEGGVFVVEIDRVEGIEIRLASGAEVKLLSERFAIPALLGASSMPANGEETPTALIVEDDGGRRHALGRLLERSGYKISCAATISEAQVKLKDGPKWLILDLHLPDGDGRVLLKKVRAENLPIRVAITTGATDEDVLSDVTRLQPDAIFLKPFNPSEIIHWLDAV